jgi:hypothetical protein
MEKDFIKDGLTNEDIIKTIKEIRNKIKKSPSENNYENLKKEYDFFSTRYPMLFEISTRNEPFNWDNLNKMLEMRKKVEKNEITSDKASVIIGQQYYDKYVNIKDKEKKK